MQTERKKFVEFHVWKLLAAQEHAVDECLTRDEHNFFVRFPRIRRFSFVYINTASEFNKSAESIL